MFMLPLLCALSVFLLLGVLHQINFSELLTSTAFSLPLKWHAQQPNNPIRNSHTHAHTPKTYYCSL